MTTPAITLPDHLRPADGRFGSGPTKIPPGALQRLADVGDGLLGTSHRKPTVKREVARLQDGLAELFAVPDGYEVLLAVGGATAFWDMAAFGLVQARSLHYVFGEFSGKFARSTGLAPWLDEPVTVAAEPGTRPDLVATPDGVDVQALTHNETSTGVAMDLRRPEGDALVLVDATSGAGGLPVDVGRTDAYYFSLQKGFASEGGLVVALVSPAAVERIERIAAERYVPPILDLQVALENSRKHQTYNTPSVATVYLAAEQVDRMLQQGGLDRAVAGCRQKADHLYGWAAASDYARPFVTDPSARSSVVGTIDLDDHVDADQVNGVLRANGVLDTDAYRKLGRNQLRVGLFPAVDLADVQAYTACVDHVVERLTA